MKQCLLWGRAVKKAHIGLKNALEDIQVGKAKQSLCSNIGVHLATTFSLYRYKIWCIPQRVKQMLLIFLLIRLWLLLTSLDDKLLRFFYQATHPSWIRISTGKETLTLPVDISIDIAIEIQWSFQMQKVVLSTHLFIQIRIDGDQEIGLNYYLCRFLLIGQLHSYRGG